MASDSVVGIRLSLKQRKETVAGFKEVEGRIRGTGDAAEKAGKKASRSSRAWSGVQGALGKVGSIAKGIAKGGALGAVAFGIGTIGTALTKGFQRLTALENATAKLTGLGHSAKSVEKIMDSALAAVRGTAFGMDEAAATAAGAVAAGIKPGAALQKMLTLVGDAATIAGTGMGEMGAIFNKVATSNKLQADVINQLQDRGIPIVALLAKELGIASDEVLALSKKGEIGFDAFSKAMESGMGGAAQKSGETLQGAVKNTTAALGRIGASLLGGVYPQIKSFFTGAIGFLGQFEDHAKGAGVWIGTKLAAAVTLAQGVVTRFGPQVAAAILWAKDAAVELWAQFGPGLMARLEALGGVAQAIGGAIMDHFVPALRDLWETHGPGVTEFVSDVAEKIDSVLVPAIESVGGWIADTLVPAVSDLVGWLSDNYDLLIPLAAAWAAYTAVMKIAAAWQAAVALATKGWAAAQMLLNGAMALNPIGLVIAGIVLLGAVLVVAWKRSETFRNIVTGAFGKVKSVVMGVVNWIKTNWPLLLGILTGPIGLAVRLIAKSWDKIRGGASAVKDWITDKFTAVVGFVKGLPAKITSAASGMWNGIKTAFKSVINWIIDKWNGLSFGIPSIDIPGFGEVGGYSFSVPQIPRLAEGGIVKAQPGGILANVGEGRHDEAVVPLDGRQYLINHQGVTPLPVPQEISVRDMDAQVDSGARLDLSTMGNTAPIHVHLMVDGREIADVLLDDLDSRAARL